MTRQELQQLIEVRNITKDNAARGQLTKFLEKYLQPARAQAARFLGIVAHSIIEEDDSNPDTVRIEYESVGRAYSFFIDPSALSDMVEVRDIVDLIAEGNLGAAGASLRSLDTFVREYCPMELYTFLTED